LQQMASGEEPIIDLSELADMRAVNIVLFNAVIDQFLSDAAPHLLLIENAFAERNAEELRQQAHFFRGSSANFRAKAFGLICARIENQARAGDLTGMAGLLQEFKRELARIEDALNGAKEPNAA